MLYKNRRLQDAQSYVDDQLSKGCHNPRIQKKWNPNTNHFEITNVNCGYCEFCKYMRQQEWVRRMRYESMPYINKHVYMFTLTYDAAFLKTSKQYRDETYAVLKHNQWTPTLLCRAHSQRFFARLRRNTGKTFTYYLYGDYGDKKGRPHMHVILWSNSEFTIDEISDAWSLNGKKIGRQFNDERICFGYWLCDLVANGSLSDIRSDSPYNPSVKTDDAFRYVCEYVTEFDNNVSYVKGHPAESLIRTAYTKYGIRGKEFDRPLNRDMTHKQVTGLIKHYNDLINNNPEEFKQCYKNEEFTNKYTYNTVEEFYAQFRPYTTSSRGLDNDGNNLSIGARYLEKYANDEDKLYKELSDEYTGKPVILPKSFKRNLLRNREAILPISMPKGTIRDTDIKFADSYLSSLCAGYYTPLVETPNNRCNYMLFADRHYYYKVQRYDGQVKKFNKNGNFISFIDLHEFYGEFTQRSPLYSYIRYYNELDEYIVTKDKYFRDKCNTLGLSDDDIKEKRSNLLKIRQYENKVRQIKYKQVKNKF